MKISKQKSRQSRWGFYNWNKTIVKDYAIKAWTLYLGKTWIHFVK